MKKYVLTFCSGLIVMNFPDDVGGAGKGPKIKDAINYYEWTTAPIPSYPIAPSPLPPSLPLLPPLPPSPLLSPLSPPTPYSFTLPSSPPFLHSHTLTFGQTYQQ